MGNQAPGVPSAQSKTALSDLHEKARKERKVERWRGEVEGRWYCEREWKGLWDGVAVI